MCLPWRLFSAVSWLACLLGRFSYLLQSTFRFLPPRLHWRVTDKIRGAGNRVPRLLNRLVGQVPDVLLCIAGNPQQEPVDLEIVLSGFEKSQGGRSFRRTVSLAYGWQEILIPTRDLQGVIDFSSPFRISLTPLIDTPRLLQFLYVGFVQQRLAQADTAAMASAPHAGASKDLPIARHTPDTGKGMEGEATLSRTEDVCLEEKKVKLLAVDLDNTLWDGILVEEPDKEFVLRPGVEHVLRRLDERGILLSIVSKNAREDAKEVLERLGIWDLFVYPQINWQPKSLNLRQITTDLNIALDTVAFVDDSPFERGEVRAALPDVRVYDAAEFESLPELQSFIVPVSADSRRRRLFYRQDMARRAACDANSQSYEEFLASCRMEMSLAGLDDSNRERVFELVQRTNQLNFSGNRYSRGDLARLVSEPAVVPVTMSCEDRFGQYGLVGFAIMRAEGRILTIVDMMFSCRVQGKMVEHAFLDFVLREAARAGFDKCVCVYNRTARNARVADVFAMLGFVAEPREPETGVALYAKACPTDVAVSFPVTIRGKLGREEFGIYRDLGQAG